jgi:hypothetical protein
MSAGIAMLSLLLQNYANPFVFAVVIFFAHVRKKNFTPLFYITHQRSRLVNTAQIVVRYVLAVDFSATSTALRTLKRCFCACGDNRLLGVQTVAEVMSDHKVTKATLCFAAEQAARSGC